MISRRDSGAGCPELRGAIRGNCSRVVHCLSEPPLLVAEELPIAEEYREAERNLDA